MYVSMVAMLYDSYYLEGNLSMLEKSFVIYFMKAVCEPVQLKLDIVGESIN